MNSLTVFQEFFLGEKPTQNVIRLRQGTSLPENAENMYEVEYTPLGSSVNPHCRPTPIW